MAVSSINFAELHRGAMFLKARPGASPAQSAFLRPLRIAAGRKQTMVSSVTLSPRHCPHDLLR